MFFISDKAQELRQVDAYSQTVREMIASDNLINEAFIKQLETEEVIQLREGVETLKLELGNTQKAKSEQE
eukprot:CAMPEP_0170544006 /NCGR_PEP_ID=MMETSP0211-20121228/2924_1 /TAXON_ID=311385 /ORGANISM="Pseudokeronopsis sp., Strain OXSARD2" /LENGTH=69 /DNA_ID=CAMNT_0010847541 /DNA_START=877 /DNA_END=1086 /DNA_ORIENTATION=-